MRKIVVAGLSLGYLIVPCAVAAQVDDTARFEQGQQLYEARCARCHGTSGDGNPPTFPALAGTTGWTTRPGLSRLSARARETCLRFLP